MLDWNFVGSYSILILCTFPIQTDSNQLSHSSIRGFPEIGVPLVIIHFNRILHHKPTIFGYPHDYGTPHLMMMNQLVLSRHYPMLSQYYPIINYPIYFSYISIYIYILINHILTLY